jgi:Ca2+-transporting ATPase
MVVGIYVGVACVASFAFWYVAPHDQAYFGLTNSNDGHTIVSWDQLRDWNKCKDYYGPEKTVTSAAEIPDLWKDFAPKAFTTTMGGHTWEPKDDPCTYFTDGKKKASTLSLSVLVAIEMLNALNALSEDGSLLHMPPWVNPYLIVAMLVSFGMHAVILYIPWMSEIFAVQPLDLNENLVVLAFSMPVIFIEEILKAIGRARSSAELAERMKED